MIPKISLLIIGSALAIDIKTKNKCPFGFTSELKPGGTKLA